MERSIAIIPVISNIPLYRAVSRFLPEMDDSVSEVNVEEHKEEIPSQLHKLRHLLAAGFGPQLFSYDLRAVDDNGDVPLRLTNQTQLNIVTLGLIVVPELGRHRIKVRLIPILAGSSQNILAKADEEFIFVKYPLANEGSNQPVGFCSMNGHRMEYYLQARTASEIGICNKIEGIRSLVDLCSDAVLAFTGISEAAIKQLSLSGVLKDNLIDKLMTQDSFTRANNLLDAWITGMKFLHRI